MKLTVKVGITSVQAWTRLPRHVDLFRQALMTYVTFYLECYNRLSLFAVLCLACLKFHQWKPKHLSFVRIFVANLMLFRFHSFDFLFKSNLFSVENTFVFEKRFFANVIFFHFHSLSFLISRLTACHHTHETSDYTRTMELTNRLAY